MIREFVDIQLSFHNFVTNRHSPTFKQWTFDPTFRCLRMSSSSNELQKRDTAIAANRVVAKHRYAKSVTIKYLMYRVGKVIRLGKCAYMVWFLFMWDLTSQMVVEELIISNEIFARFAFKVSIRVNIYEECKIGIYFFLNWILFCTWIYRLVISTRYLRNILKQLKIFIDTYFSFVSLMIKFL